MTLSMTNDETAPPTTPKKDPAAVELGTKGGKKSTPAKARAAKINAKKATAARWPKKTPP